MQYSKINVLNVFIYTAEASSLQFRSYLNKNNEDFAIVID